MAIDYSEFMVRYDKWCVKCKYKDRDENKDPCEECLENPTNINTERPINFTERQGSQNGKEMAIDHSVQ